MTLRDKFPQGEIERKNRQRAKVSQEQLDRLPLDDELERIVHQGLNQQEVDEAAAVDADIALALGNIAAALPDLSSGEKKYELVRDQSIEVGGRTLYRIRALKDFGDVRRGDAGGYVETEDNLSQDGDCWVYGNAIVCGNEIVTDGNRGPDKSPDKPAPPRI